MTVAGIEEDFTVSILILSYFFFPRETAASSQTCFAETAHSCSSVVWAAMLLSSWLVGWFYSHRRSKPAKKKAAQQHCPCELVVITNFRFDTIYLSTTVLFKYFYIFIVFQS